MRKAAEARDDLVVPFRVLHVLRVERMRQSERTALRGEILRVLEGQMDKDALDR